MSDTTQSIKLDEGAARRLRSLAASLDVPPSRLIRELVLYIDDRAAPCGRLSAFARWREGLRRRLL